MNEYFDEFSGQAETNYVEQVTGGTANFTWLWVIVVILTLIGVAAAYIWFVKIKKQRDDKEIERGLKMVPMLIHLPPQTDDIQGNGRDERDVTNEAISSAQVMYSIIASTIESGWKAKINGQKHVSFEMVVSNGFIKYYAVVPAVMTETVKQAVVSSYPTARLEEVDEENIFSKEGGISGVAGGELTLKKESAYPIATYEEMKWDGAVALLNALSNAKSNEGIGVQILFRPADDKWIKKSTGRVQEIRDGKKKSSGFDVTSIVTNIGDIVRAPIEPPEAREKRKDEEKQPLTNLQQSEIESIEGKTRYPGFEVLIRTVASAQTKARAEALLGGVVSAFSQFDSPANNGFRYDSLKDMDKLTSDYVLRVFPPSNHNMILNSMELATLFHLPSQASIPNSQVERQATKQVDGPAKIPSEGIWLGVNEFRGQKKKIMLAEKDRRRHTYIIGATGMGKSVLMKNIAYQDIMAGRGFAFIDPHGDVTEELLGMIPPERMDDVIYFDPGDIEHPMGMNMFEFTSDDQKDFIVQEGINMLTSLYDPNNQGFFGARGQHMFRNAALLLMSDPSGATFIDIPRCFTDPEFVKEKLKYVTDKAVFDYWTKEFPESKKSSDSGEVTTWFASKWGPFLANTMMRNTMGQVKSGFDIRDIMDNQKILLVNLSKGKLGEVNSKLLGMIFVMKFQTAAMSRVDTPEDQRKDFCLYVDEFQNFATESFESILSEARKFRLNLIVANQFMTQLTDKIREGILGNVGSIIAGRVGITDAEMLEKAFVPTFNAEDLHNQPNHHAIATVMMFDMPSKPFTMKLNPPLADTNREVMESMRIYSATKYGRTRAEVEKEVNERLGAMGDSTSDATGDAGSDGKKGSFLDAWKEKKNSIPEMKMGADGLPVVPGAEQSAPVEQAAPVAQSAPTEVVNNPQPEETEVFQDVIPDEEVEEVLHQPAENMSMPDKNVLEDDQVIQLH